MRFIPYHKSSTFARFVCASLVLFVAATITFAQSDVTREAVAITYPLDETISVKFRGTTRLPRLSGSAKVKRSGRRGARVELSIERLPRAFELGGAYTTYVLWAISPEGQADKLAEIKRSGSFIVDTKVDATTPLETFALIVTAEPHFMVRSPSRMVVLENLPPQNAKGANVATLNIRYVGNTSDYFNDARIPSIAEADYVRTPVSLLGARQALNLAKYVGAERDAKDELSEASTLLEQAETAWREGRGDSEVDALARRATSLGAHAEEVALERRSQRERREEMTRRDQTLREAEQTNADANQQLTALRGENERERRERDLTENNLANANRRITELQTEINTLREELRQTRAEGEDAKVKLARIEGERAAETARRGNEQRISEQRLAAGQLKQTLARFGAVRETASGLTVTIAETMWANPRTSEPGASAQSVLEQLAAMLANNPDYRVMIEAHTDGRGDGAQLQKLTQERAEWIVAQLTGAGLDAARFEAVGLGASKPVASNNNATGRTKNRRTEITLTLPAPNASAPATGDTGSN